MVVADELLAAASEENKVLSAKVDALTAELEKLLHIFAACRKKQPSMLRALKRA